MSKKEIEKPVPPPKSKRKPAVKKRKRGRQTREVVRRGRKRKPPAYTSDVKWRIVVVQNLANGTTIAAACNAASIQRSTYYANYNDNKQFAAACDDAMKCRLSIVVDSLFISSRKGDTAAGKFLTKNWSKGEYKDQHDVTAKVTGPSTIIFQLESPKDYGGFEGPKKDSKDKPA